MGGKQGSKILFLVVYIVLWMIMVFSRKARMWLAPRFLKHALRNDAIRDTLPIMFTTEFITPQGFSVDIQTNYFKLPQRMRLTELECLVDNTVALQNYSREMRKLLVYDKLRYKYVPDTVHEPNPRIIEFNVLGELRGFSIVYRFYYMGEVPQELTPEATSMHPPMPIELHVDFFPEIHDARAIKKETDVQEIADRIWVDSTVPLTDGHPELFEEDGERCHVSTFVPDTAKTILNSGCQSGTLGEKYERESGLAQSTGDDSNSLTWDHSEFEEAQKTPIIQSMGGTGVLTSVTCPTTLEGRTAIITARMLNLADPEEVVQITTDGLAELYFLYVQPDDDPNLEIQHRRQKSLPLPPNGFRWTFYPGNRERKTPMKWDLEGTEDWCSINTAYRLKGEKARRKAAEMDLYNPPGIMELVFNQDELGMVTYSRQAVRSTFEATNSLPKYHGKSWHNKPGTTDDKVVHFILR